MGKYAPNDAVLGDMGWFPFIHKQWKCATRLWCRLNNMSSNRLNRKVFIWADQLSDRHKCVKNWSFYIKKMFCDLNLSHFCNITEFVDTNFKVNCVLDKLSVQFITEWKTRLLSDHSLNGRGGNKLRTYMLFKGNFETEFYCKTPIPFKHRSFFLSLDVVQHQFE